MQRRLKEHSSISLYEWTALPKDGAYPHDIAVVENIIREQGQSWVALIPHAGVHNATGQEGTRLQTTGKHVRVYQ